MSDREEEKEEAQRQEEEAPPEEVRLCDFIDERREDILREWEDRARSALAAAQNLSEPSLRDNLPQLLAWIGAVVRTAHAGKATTPGELPEVHAHHRIRDGYELFEVASELSLLRQVILDLWCSHVGPIAQVKEVARLDAAIDLLMARSLQAFAAAEQREVRERLDLERQMIGIVAHDLRNPLSVVSTAAEALLRQPADTRVLRAAVRIRSSALRAGRLIQDLLDFTQARLGSGIPVIRAPADLHSIVHDVVEERRIQSADREIHHRQEGGGTAMLDADRVAQVAQNLLGNAIKYGAPDSPITIRTAGEDDAVVLSVNNRGTPIPADMLVHLFEPLRQGQDRRSKEGVGLGLYIVESIVRAHGGAVHVESTEAEGTTFTVRFPRSPPPGSPPLAGRPAAV